MNSWSAFFKEHGDEIVADIERKRKEELDFSKVNEEIAEENNRLEKELSGMREKILGFEATHVICDEALEVAGKYFPPVQLPKQLRDKMMELGRKKTLEDLMKSETGGGIKSLLAPKYIGKYRVSDDKKSVRIGDCIFNKKELCQIIGVMK